jgi:hypothetical protein
MSNSTSLASLLPTPHGNPTLIANSDLCTLTTCDLTLTHFGYLPSMGGNALFAQSLQAVSWSSYYWASNSGLGASWLQPRLEG